MVRDGNTNGAFPSCLCLFLSVLCRLPRCSWEESRLFLLRPSFLLRRLERLVGAMASSSGGTGRAGDAARSSAPAAPP